MWLQRERILFGTSRDTGKWRWLTALTVLTLCVVSVRIAVAQQTGAATLVGTITDSTSF